MNIKNPITGGEIINEEDYKGRMQALFRDAPIDIILKGKGGKLYQFNLSEVIHQSVETRKPYFESRFLIELEEKNNCISRLEDSMKDKQERFNKILSIIQKCKADYNIERYYEEIEMLLKGD